MPSNYAQEFIKQLYSTAKLPDAEQLFKLKNNFSSQYHIPNLKNIELIKAYQELLENNQIQKNLEVERLISRRKIRSESGVSVITCLTKPFACPGKCTYCPTEPNMPKSYLSNQPAAMRAVLNKFDAFNQVQNRLASLMVTGHKPSKVEIIIIGGTWSFLPKDYQEDFIKDIYNGLNQKVESSDIEKNGQFFKIPKIEKSENLCLEEALKKNENSEYRCVGLTLETRPDFITEEELQRFREYGCTRVEIGVQSLDDEVQRITKRGHDVKTVEKATKMLRDAG
ncbi:radical SAM protein, partial [Candidatus Peregrinibacteria bacterium]|nr:radical SAM protein [Candidatus Peregrinibacteria bacterium]